VASGAPIDEWFVPPASTDTPPPESIDAAREPPNAINRSEEMPRTNGMVEVFARDKVV
jgi:hypothetical protein